MPSPQLTDDDKDRARHHLGYGGVQEASTFVLGVPAGVQTTFVIERAFTKLLAVALPRMRDIMDKLDRIEAQVDENIDALVASKVGEIDLSDKEFEKLIQRYKHWQGALGNLLQVPPNPYDQRPYLGGGYNGRGSMNAPVIG